MKVNEMYIGNNGKNSDEYFRASFIAISAGGWYSGGVFFIGGIDLR